MTVQIGTFVALGDSFTEGLDDPRADQAGYLGWADRFAQMLAGQQPGLRYANLAVRGKRLGQVADEQVPQAIAMAPDLVSLAAGGNDLLGLPVRSRRAGADVRRRGPYPADGGLPGAHLHRVRSAVPGAAADPRQGGGLQHAPARDRRPARLRARGPVVDGRAARPAGVERGPAAPDPGRRTTGWRCAPARCSAWPSMRTGASPGPRRGRPSASGPGGLAGGPPDGPALGARPRGPLGGPPPSRHLLRRQHRPQAPRTAPPVTRPARGVSSIYWPSAGGTYSFFVPALAAFIVAAVQLRREAS